MSTTEPQDSVSELTVIQNEQNGTVTFAADQPDNLALPATEWITASIDDLVDPYELR